MANAVRTGVYRSGFLAYCPLQSCSRVNPIYLMRKKLNSEKRIILDSSLHMIIDIGAMIGLGVGVFLIIQSRMEKHD